MGMDVYGISPKSEQGEYFRNNVWWWHPLWEYCQKAHPELVGDDPTGGHYNDGYGLDEDGAINLGRSLLLDWENGLATLAERLFHEERAALPPIPCEYCDSTGIRTDGIGIKLGMPEQELSPAVAAYTGRTHGYCNGCEGVGHLFEHATAYNFSADNVRKFALFLLDSGGFAIE